MNQRICKKCLLKDLSQEEYFKNVYEYLEQMDEELKAEEGEYQRRLSVCQTCDQLVNGMCRVCGCFVELRAAKKEQYCPSPKHYW